MKRREEILQTAARLFESKGYDDTSTNDIVNEVGIARGTLYHHFKSKEDILDALIDQMGSSLIEQASRIASDKEIPVLERLLATIQSLNMNTKQDYILEQIHQPQNALMHEKSRKILLEQVPALLCPIVQDGINQGLMTTLYPYEACEMIMAYALDYFDDEAPQVSQTNEEKRMIALVHHMELLLGTSTGLFADFLQAIMKD